MFKAKVIDTFSAAHSLRGYQGDCERLHGHNYRVEVIVGADVLDQVGIVMDFRELKGALKTVLKEMDHQFLNDLPAFAVDNASAEHIARHIFRALQGKIGAPVALLEVIVWENDTCCALYQE